MKLRNGAWIAALTLAALAIFFPPTSVFAQSCALCYTQAASSGPRMIQALRSGILILIAPPTFMSIGMFFVCYRKRNQTRDEIESGYSDREWTEDSAVEDSTREKW